MRTCKRCNKEKEESEFRGLNKSCSECLDKIINSDAFKKYKSSEKFKEIHKKSDKKYRDTEKGKEANKKAQNKYRNSEKGQEVSIISNRKNQKKFTLKLKAKRINIEILFNIVENICTQNNLSKIKIANEISFTRFAIKDSYPQILAITTFAVLKYGNEADKQNFINLINKDIDLT
jgi:hypothetical protein